MKQIKILTGEGLPNIPWQEKPQKGSKCTNMEIPC